MRRLTAAVNLVIALRNRPRLPEIGREHVRLRRLPEKLGVCRIRCGRRAPDAAEGPIGRAHAVRATDRRPDVAHESAFNGVAEVPDGRERCRRGDRFEQRVTRETARETGCSGAADRTALRMRMQRELRKYPAARDASSDFVTQHDRPQHARDVEVACFGFREQRRQRIESRVARCKPIAFVELAPAAGDAVCESG
jgi:hypothetical protein